MARTSMALLPLLVLAACTTSKVQSVTFADVANGLPVPLAKADAVVVLNAKPWWLASRPPEDDEFTNCIRDSLENENKDYRLLPARELHDDLSPLFKSPLFKKVVIDPEALLSNQSTRQRMRELRVRYIVTIGGITASNLISETDSYGRNFVRDPYIGKSGFMECSYGCLGLLVGDRKTGLSAKIWDVATGFKTATIYVMTDGANITPAFLLPVPFIAPTETTACLSLGNHLDRLFRLGELPKTTVEKTDEREGKGEKTP